MKGLVVYSDVGSDRDVPQFTDKKYFRLLANRFQRANSDADIHIETFDEYNSGEFFRDLGNAAYQNLDVFAYIGHGGPNALYSASINTAAERQQLGDTLISTCNDNATIIFYACSAGTLNNSILDTLHRATISKNFTLYGHSTIGRAGNNPNKTVFPPQGGSMLIDAILGDLSDSPAFRRAWNATFGNESDNLWATFWRLDDDELLHRACKPAIDRAMRANRRYMSSLGWRDRIDEIFLLCRMIPPRNSANMSEDDQRRLVLGVGLWQAATFSNKRDIDGIIGPGTWRRMQPEL